jgi:hypothetical protein
MIEKNYTIDLEKKFAYLTTNELYLQTINNNGQVAFIT